MFARKYVVNDGVTIVIKNITFNAGSSISSDVFDSFGDFERLVKIGKIRECNVEAKTEEKAVEEEAHAQSVNLEGESETVETSEKKGKKRKSK